MRGVIAGGFGVVAITIGASAAGLLGDLGACGADGARVCVTWPTAASVATWLVFLGCIAALLAWHVRDWRRGAGPAANDN
jgi:hypothetical protein